MLDESLEYKQYSFNFDEYDKYVDRLKRSSLISSNKSGLNRTLTTIARHFLYDVYEYGKDGDTDRREKRKKTKAALTSWLGLKRPSDNPDIDEIEDEEAYRLYKWLFSYADRVLLAGSVSDLKDIIADSSLPETEKHSLGAIIEQLTDRESQINKKELAEQLVAVCKRLSFIPNNNRQDQAILKIENFIQETTQRRSFYFSGYSATGEASDINAITFDRIIANAIRAGRFKKYYLACEKSCIENVKQSSNRELKDTDRDIVFKLTACCMLEMSKKGTERVQKTKTVTVNGSDLTNWLILKKCEKDKLLKFQYDGKTLFGHPAFSGVEKSEDDDKSTNTKRIKLDQKWIDDSGFEILIDDPETDVIKNFLQSHQDGSVFIDNGSGEAMTEKRWTDFDHD